MKKRFIRLFMFATMLVGVGALNSCKDYDEDRYTDLEYSLQDLKAELASQKTYFENAIAAIKQCECSGTSSCGCPDVNQAIQDALNAYAQQHPDGITAAEAAQIASQAIADYMAAHPYPETGLTESDVNALIQSALAGYKSCACTGDDLTKDDVATIVSSMLAEYLKKSDALTADEVQNMIDASIKNWATQEELQNALNKITDLENNKADKSEVTALTDALAEAKAAAEQAVANLTQMINDANSNITTNTTNISNLQTAVDGLQSVVDDLTPRVAALESNLAKAQADATEALTTAKDNATKIETMEATYSAILDKIMNEIYPALTDADSQLKTTCENLQSQIDEINEKIKDVATKQDVAANVALAYDLYNKAIKYTDEAVAALSSSVNNQFDNVNGSINTINGNINLINTTLADLDKAYKEADEKLESEIADLQSKLADLTSQVEANKKAIDAFNGRLNKLITSILVQGTTNPVIGSLSLPVGIQSNMLLAYYGENEHKTFFPTVSTSDLVYECYALTDKDAEMLGSIVDGYSIPGQTTFLSNDDKAYAGKVYLTINPNTVDFTGASFSLVNSRDEESPIKLGTVAKSDDLLKFGYTRADNGFYEVPAYVSKDDVEKAKIDIDTTAWKNAAKDIIEQSNGIQFTELASTLYNQFTNITDATGIKATWTDDSKQYSTYSNYNIAAGAIKPLSFAFLKDVTIGRLPEISPLDELDIDLNDYIDWSKYTINCEKEFMVYFDKIYADNGKVYCQYHIGQNGAVTNYTFELGTQNAELAQRINDHASDWSAQAQSAYKTQFLDRVQSLIDELNNMNNGATGRLSSNVQEIIDDANEQINNKANEYINKINDKFITRLNNAFARINRNLNHANFKLQPEFVYEGEDGTFHKISNYQTFPTFFEGTGAIMIYPTSATAELIAPAYKKFIGVTNVFKDDKSAQDGDTDCLNVLKKTNAADNFCKVLPGGSYGVAFQPAASGYTYEIFLSALDYSGKISQQKFYVTVK